MWYAVTEPHSVHICTGGDSLLFKFATCIDKYSSREHAKLRAPDEQYIQRADYALADTIRLGTGVASEVVRLSAS